MKDVRLVCDLCGSTEDVHTEYQFETDIQLIKNHHAPHAIVTVIFATPINIKHETCRACMKKVLEGFVKL